MGIISAIIGAITAIFKLLFQRNAKKLQQAAMDAEKLKAMEDRASVDREVAAASDADVRDRLRKWGRDA